jgi:26S proteasome regulatory subunit N2
MPIDISKLLLYLSIHIYDAIILQIAKAFGMKVVGWSPHLTPERAASSGVGFVATKEQLFKESDVVSIHLVLSDKTNGIITKEDLLLMKPTAFFINTSRGPLVDEAALLQVLEEERIAGAGLDVFDIEPLPLEHPLRRAKRVTLSPHTGYLSDSNYAVCLTYIS